MILRIPRHARAPIWFACAALLLKALLAWLTIGTNDSLTWNHDLVKLRSEGFAQLYREGVQYSSPEGSPYPRQDFIHPPAMITALKVIGALQDTTGVPLRFWMRIACALADIGMLVVVWMLLGGWLDRDALKSLALSPISVLISGFHTNTDPIMIFLVVLAVLLIERGRIGWAGAAFGFAACIKIVPVIFVPAILLYLPDFRTRARWAASAALVWLAASMPYIALEPMLIVKTMLGYSSAVGIWGFYMFTTLLQPTRLGWLHTIYAPAAKWIALAAIALAPAALRYFRGRTPLFAQAGLVVFLFLFLSPGFAVQYLAWTVPWIVALGFAATSIYQATTGTCLVVVYAAATRGGLTTYADVFHVDMNIRVLVRLICWIAVGAMVWLFARFAAASGQDAAPPVSQSTRKEAVA